MKAKNKLVSKENAEGDVLIHVHYVHVIPCQNVFIRFPSEQLVWNRGQEDVLGTSTHLVPYFREKLFSTSKSKVLKTVGTTPSKLFISCN